MAKSRVRGKTAKVLRLLSGAQTITDNGNTLAWVKRKESITTVGPNALQPDERLNTIAKVGQNSDSANFVVDKKSSESQKSKTPLAMQLMNSGNSLMNLCRGSDKFPVTWTKPL